MPQLVPSAVMLEPIILLCLLQPPLVLRFTPWTFTPTAARSASTAGTLQGRRSSVDSGMDTSKYWGVTVFFK
jgi:hypothetical protein